MRCLLVASLTLGTVFALAVGGAQAAPINLTTQFAQSSCGATVSGDSSLAIDTICTAAETGNRYSAEAWAKASYTNGVLTLGAKDTGVVVANNLPGGVASNATAAVHDVVTLEGAPAGQNGFLTLIFTLEGSETCNGIVSNNFCNANFFLGFGAFAGFTVNGQFKNVFTSPSVLQFDVPMTFGTATPLDISLRVGTGTLSFANTATPGTTATADFLNTATLTSFSVLDSNKQVLLDGSVLSEAGLPFQVQAVPEPATLLLVGSGIATAVKRRRRTRSDD